MYDINFFEENRKQRYKKKTDRFSRRMAISLALGLTLGIFTGNLLIIKKLEDIQYELEKSLSDPGRIQKAEENEEKRNELLFLKAYEAWLSGFDSRVNKLYIDSDQWVGQVFNNTGTNVIVEQVIQNGNSLTIRGTAGNLTAVALYKDHLSGIPHIMDVNIQQLLSGNGGYRFTIAVDIGFWTGEP